MWFSECENSGAVRQSEKCLHGRGECARTVATEKWKCTLSVSAGRYRRSGVSDFRKQEFQRRAYPQVPEQEGLLTIEKNWRRGCAGAWDELLERESVGPNAQASVDLPINSCGSRPVSSIFRKNHDPRVHLRALVPAGYFFRKRKPGVGQ